MLLRSPVLDRISRGDKNWLTLQVRQLKNIDLILSHHPGPTLSRWRHAVLVALRGAASDDPRSDPPAAAPGRRP